MSANDGINTMLANATINVSIAHSSFGIPEPQIEVSYPRGTHFRAVRAVLFALAAKAEAATPMSERWMVEVDAGGDQRGRVYFELLNADEAETRRGLEVLRQVAGGKS